VEEAVKLVESLIGKVLQKSGSGSRQ